jgi:hypothetical protein
LTTRSHRRASSIFVSALALLAVPSPVFAEETVSAAAGEPSVPRPSEPVLSRVQTGGLVFAGPVIGLARGAPVSPWPVVLDEIGQVGGLTLLVAGDTVSWGASASVTRCRDGGVCLGAGGYF